VLGVDGKNQTEGGGGGGGAEMLPGDSLWCVCSWFSSLPGSCRQGILHHTSDHRSKFVPIHHLIILLPFEAAWTKFLTFFFCLHPAIAPSWPGPHYRGLTITLCLTTLGRTPLDD